MSLEVPILERTATAVDCTPYLSDTLALAPEGVILCSASLELTQDNIDEGSIRNAVFARGEANDGQAVLGEDTVEQEIVQAAGLSVGMSCAHPQMCGVIHVGGICSTRTSLAWRRKENYFRTQMPAPDVRFVFKGHMVLTAQ